MIRCIGLAIVDYADIRVGTNSYDTLSHGNVLPLIMRPWGFNSFAPQTVGTDGAWWFHPEQGFLKNFRLTHQAWLNLGEVLGKSLRSTRIVLSTRRSALLGACFDG